MLRSRAWKQSKVDRRQQIASLNLKVRTSQTKSRRALFQRAHTYLNNYTKKTQIGFWRHQFMEPKQNLAQLGSHVKHNK